MTPEEMRDAGDWQHAWYEAQYGSYGPPFDYENRKDVIPDDFALNQVVEVIAESEGENDGPDWVCVARMQDGRYAVMSAGCDYTGWDCQASGRIDYHDTLEEATSPNGLLQKFRDRLKDQLVARGLRVDFPPF